LEPNEISAVGQGGNEFERCCEVACGERGPNLFAAGLIVIGCQHFFFGQFVPMIVPLWPAWIPGRLFWVYLVETILIVGGGAVISGIKARLAATLPNPA